MAVASELLIVERGEGTLCREHRRSARARRLVLRQAVCEFRCLGRIANVHHGARDQAATYFVQHNFAPELGG
jgi:hypothetical protein